jgi:hypothetical protein
MMCMDIDPAGLALAINDLAARLSQLENSK